MGSQLRTMRRAAERREVETGGFDWRWPLVAALILLAGWCAS